MKILVISVFPPAEVPDADHAYRISAHLARRGLDVHVLTQKDARVADDSGLHLHPVMTDWSWAEMPRLINCIRQTAPDVILLVYVGHMYHRHPMIAYAATVAKLVLPRVRFVTQFEYSEGFRISPMLGFLQRGVSKLARMAGRKSVDWQFGTLLRKSDAVIVLSGAHLPVLKKAFGNVEAKSTLIPPPILMRMAEAGDEEQRVKRREALGVKPGEILLAYLGYIYYGKGVETLLAAFEQVCRRRSDVRLVIIGGTLASTSDTRPGYVQEIYTMAAQETIKNRVFLTGGFDVESEEPSQILHAADIAVLPLDPGIRLNNSSFGGVVAHGLPVITTQGDQLEAPFVPGENVFLFPPMNVALLSAAIEKLIDDEALRHKLQAGSRRIAEEWFSWDSAINRMMGVLQKGPSPANLTPTEQLPRSV